jgi:hypothetical protein
MSVYALQKLIRDVNRRPQCREAYFQAPDQFAQGYDLAASERARGAAQARHGRALRHRRARLLLRPFTILHKAAEPDYLKAIRGE